MLKRVSSDARGLFDSESVREGTWLSSNRKCTKMEEVRIRRSNRVRHYAGISSTCLDCIDGLQQPDTVEIPHGKIHISPY